MSCVFFLFFLFLLQLNGNHSFWSLDGWWMLCGCALSLLKGKRKITLQEHHESVNCVRQSNLIFQTWLKNNKSIIAQMQWSWYLYRFEKIHATGLKFLHFCMGKLLAALAVGQRTAFLYHLRTILMPAVSTCADICHTPWFVEVSGLLYNSGASCLWRRKFILTV